jgi:hypothetical protein
VLSVFPSHSHLGSNPSLSAMKTFYRQSHVPPGVRVLCEMSFDQ